MPSRGGGEQTNHVGMVHVATEHFSPARVVLSARQSRCHVARLGGPAELFVAFLEGARRCRGVGGAPLRCQSVAVGRNACQRHLLLLLLYGGDVLGRGRRTYPPQPTAE